MASVDQILYVASRIKREGDGIEFINYLKDMSERNYKAWKCCSVEFNEIHKGQAIILDKLLDLFEKCDDTINQINLMKEKEPIDTM
jgi:hypothetical protein